MASKFYLVHHTFKPEMAEKWWANMSDYDEAKQKTHQENWAKAGVYCHTFMPTGKEGTNVLYLGSQRRSYRFRLSKFY